MRSEIKGITHQARFAGKPIEDWKIFCLPMNSVDRINYSTKPATRSGPTFFRGEFQLSRPGDVFLDLGKFSKGAVWVNGHAIGRFWNVGPQQTLYVPGPWLRSGKNDIVVFDLFGREDVAPPQVAGLPQPILDAPVHASQGAYPRNQSAAVSTKPNQ